VPAVIELNFDPFLRIGDIAVRWQTIELTFALLAAIAVATLVAPRRRFFRDRMTLVIAGIVPGAAVGGRAVHVLVYWDAYVANPTQMFNPFVGSLSLTGAVLGGAITAAFLARIVGAPVGRWADAAAIPFLIAIGFGKLAQLLGGSGQGLPFDGPWAVAFLGNGPWISADPALPSHPSQVYEGIWILAGIPIVIAWVDGRRWLGDVTGAGSLFVVTLVWFLLGRIAVGFTWRDERLIGPINAEQAIAAVALVAVVLVAWNWPARSPEEPPEYRFGERRQTGARP
jgi:phosphatidylglycerol:prolipoprotein diacylglycerol transferase